MKFRGHICVPGMQSPSISGNNNDVDVSGIELMTIVTTVLGMKRATTILTAATIMLRHPTTRGVSMHWKLGKTYELIVLEKEKDALGNDFLLATHAVVNI